MEKQDEPFTLEADTSNNDFRTKLHQYRKTIINDKLEGKKSDIMCTDHIQSKTLTKRQFSQINKSQDYYFKIL
ncbi:hypothetical protein A3Q56_00255 [Intoshia linei]|uniref:Uncharacterized protein n=1 Tax=Intoshia linei TaxID=1819745 RepID=A0A177BEJ0_9BILA|nr:hypothetical protein A3Q56_00255 [Intoshia linei]